MPADAGKIRRTDLKIQYAELMFAELKNHYDSNIMDDMWEVAHEEACMYHLTGAVEGIVNEVASAYGISLVDRKIDYASVRKAIIRNGRESPAVDAINRLRDDKSSWLSLLYEMRNHGAHRDAVQKITGFQAVGGMARVVYREAFDPRTGKPLGRSMQELIHEFCDNVKALVEQSRKTYP